MDLRQPGFTYSVCGPFTENKERIQKIKETGDSRYVYQNELHKACFQHDTTYEDFKNLPRRTASYKILRDKAFNIAKNPNYDGYQRGLASMVYKSFDKKTSGSGIKNENISNKRALDLSGVAHIAKVSDRNISDRKRELAEELQKPIIRKFNKRKIQSPFIDNIWGADLADIQLISKFNKRFRFLLCVIDIYSKYAWVILLKDKKDTTITNAFQKYLKNLIANQTKYGFIKAVNFIIDQ